MNTYAMRGALVALPLCLAGCYGHINPGLSASDAHWPTTWNGIVCSKSWPYCQVLLVPLVDPRIPRMPGPPPGQPAPDLNVHKISCDAFYIGGHLVVQYLTAHVQNAGDADVLASSVTGNSVTVTVIATLDNGNTEINGNAFPGNFTAGADYVFHVGLMQSWDHYRHVNVSASTDFVWQENNYSNNVLDADVSTGGGPKGGTGPGVYCEAIR